VTAFLTLVDNDLVSLDTFIIYSKPVMAGTRENNFKNPRRNTRDKTEKAKRNPQATLGYYSYQSLDGKERSQLFFWWILHTRGRNKNVLDRRVR